MEGRVCIRTWASKRALRSWGTKYRHVMKYSPLYLRQGESSDRGVSRKTRLLRIVKKKNKKNKSVTQLNEHLISCVLREDYQQGFASFSGVISM